MTLSGRQGTHGPSELVRLQRENDQLRLDVTAERERCVQILKWYATDDGRLMQNDISPIVAAIRKGE